LKKAGILVLVSALVLCLGVGAALAEEPIKVGYLAALTGDWAAYGQTEVNSAQLAVEEINADGGVLGRPLELVVYDWRTRVEDGVNAVRRMIEKDDVVAIVGANGSSINIAIAPLVNEAGVPQIGTVGTNVYCTIDRKGNVYPYSFRICFTDPYQGKVLAYFAAEDLGLKKAAVLYDVGSDYSQGFRKYFIENFENYGGEIVEDQAFRGGVDVDFRAQLTKIRDSGAEVLILPNMGKEMALTIKQAHELGMDDLVVMGGDGYADFMWDIAGESMEGTYWVNHVSPEDPNMQPFFEDYKVKYNDECKEFVNGILAYDAVYWLADAIERAGAVDSDAIAKALESSQGVQLHHAVITVDPADHNPVDKDAVMLVCEDGKAQFLKMIKPE